MTRRLATIHPATGTRYDEPLYISPSGRRFYPIGGASDDADADGDDDDAGDDDADQDRTFTQAEMNAIMSREKKAGKRTGQLELAKSLGYETIEEMTEAAKAQKKAADKAKTEEQRRADELAERERKAEARERAAEAREREVARKDVLRDLGAKGQDLADALLLLGAVVDADADEDDLAEAAEALKARRPALFGEGSDDDDDAARTEAERKRKRTKTTLPGGGPKGPKRPQQGTFGQGGLDQARRRGFITDDA